MSHISSRDLRCPVTGKAAYINEARALQAVERAWTRTYWRNQHGQMPNRVYECPDCGWWHLTSKRQLESA